MTSLATAGPLPAAGPAGAPIPSPDCSAYVRAEDGLSVLHLMMEGIHCGACVHRIEAALQAMPDIRHARVNLTTKRLVIKWQGEAVRAGDWIGALAALGYAALPYDPQKLGRSERRRESELLRAMAVAGFAAANVMLLSVAVWAGHFQDMGPETRALLHWFSALIALPAIAWAGRPFFRSALEALRHGRTNMDVPISLGVILAAGVSLWETARGGPHAYFDSAITLLFFLLIGRFLDSLARGRARSAAERLVALDGAAVTVIEGDGRTRTLPPDALRPGMIVLVAPGERIPADGEVSLGCSDVDTSLITGETLPAAVGPGTSVFAGTVNLGAAIRVVVGAVGEATLLAEIVRLMEVAEQRRARFVGIADRVARLYAPVVHVLALAAFLGWTVLGGLDWQPAMMIAVAVLIVTCPCALGLAVPAVQVLASGRLMRRGILLKSATALERLAGVDTVVFDKTGTLTLGRPRLLPGHAADAAALACAAGLAATSRHPLARALAAAVPGTTPAEGVREVPGCGLLLDAEDGEVRLGSRRWCGIDHPEDGAGAEMWFVRPGADPIRFAFEDEVRADAAQVMDALRRRGIAVELLSGDREVTVAAVASALGIERWNAGATPADKVARLHDLAAAGRTVLMVGDGLNDAPALAAASVSLSPATAVDVSRTAADAIFQGSNLSPVLELLEVACRSDRLVRQNFVLAFGYNLVAVPLAISGVVTPLIAAICMSASSLIVVGNSLRLSRNGGWKGTAA